MTRCLTYLPHSYSGRGPAESCVQVLSQFAQCGVDAELFVARQSRAISSGIAVHEGVPSVLRALPYRLVRSVALKRCEAKFLRAVETAEANTVAYFWPDTPNALVKAAKAAGLICVREMINSPLATARPILDEAYARHGIHPDHGISQACINAEIEQLALCDAVFASNPEVEAALISLGISEDRILPTTFGYTAAKLKADPVRERDPGAPFRACFVGTLTVRKGVLELLSAWEKSGVEGELLVAGVVDPAIRSQVEELAEGPGVRLLGHVDDVSEVYRMSDLLVFPTYEEGGPQVTYEAAAFGVPAITTPMGAARQVRDGETGLIVPAGDVTALAKALQSFARDPAAGQRMGEAAAETVTAFEYATVSRQRAAALTSLQAGQ